MKIRINELSPKDRRELRIWGRVSATMMAVGVLVAAATGCAFLQSHSKELKTISCAISGALLPELEALAVSLGIPLPIVEDMYAEACATAAAQGMTQEQAEKYGLEHAKMGAQRLKSFGARFDGDAGVRP